MLIPGDDRVLHDSRGQPEIAKPTQQAGERRNHADQPEILRAQQPRKHDECTHAQRHAGYLRSQPGCPAADGPFLQIPHQEDLSMFGGCPTELLVRLLSNRTRRHIADCFLRVRFACRRAAYLMHLMHFMHSDSRYP